MDISRVRVGVIIEITKITKNRQLKVTNHSDQLTSCLGVFLTRLTNIKQPS
jgi:hypothetical protein